MDVYSGALYIVARLTRHSRGKTWLQNRILDTAALTVHRTYEDSVVSKHAQGERTPPEIH